MPERLAGIHRREVLAGIGERLDDRRLGRARKLASAALAAGLKSIVPGVLTMKANTALAFVLLGTVLLRARGSRAAVLTLADGVAALAMEIAAKL